MNDIDYTKSIIAFERGLRVGDKVEVRWTAGSFGHYTAPGQVTRINQASVRVAIDKAIPSQSAAFAEAYPARTEIVVPLFSAFSRNSKWAQFNRVAPLQEVDS